jgi:CHAT domain
MATDDPENPQPGKPAAGIRQTTISGNRNSGIIAGGDIHGGIRLGNLPPPPAVGPLPSSVASEKDAATLRILFLGASPEGAPGLRIDQEVRDIDLVLRQAEFRDRFDLRQQHAVRLSDLQAALLRHRPRIVHFSGHGTVDGLCLEDESGQVRKVPGNAVARILGAFKKEIRCVVLNACYSKDQAEAIAKDIDCVVGMSSAVGDLAAIRFSAAFYQALAFGSSVAMAFNLACAQIDLEGLDEGNTPQLVAFRRDPEEIVFVEEG